MTCCHVNEYDERCDARRLGELPMCQRHLVRMFRDALVAGALPADVFKIICQDAIDELGIRMQHNDVALSSFIAAKRQQATEEAARRARAEGFVYYVRLTGDRVKIGWSRDPDARVATFRARPEDVLAVEPGDMALEARRHRQFSDERIGRSEDFEHSAQLAAHIARLAGRSA